MTKTLDQASSPLERFTIWLGGFSPEMLAQSEQVFAEDFEFRNPMLHGTGVPWLQATYAKFFEFMDRFEVEILDASGDDRRGFVLMRMTQVMKGTESSTLAVAHVEFDDDGRVRLLHEYWDAAAMVYEGIPVLGSMIRFVHRRLEHQVSG